MTLGDGTLGPDQRRQALERMASETLDVAVVGGGVVGTGVALDAAARGLSVALVEARDFAVGTSSRSSKLLHGGLRYLENLELGLVREALRERDLLLNRLCPHLAHPIPLLVPLRRPVVDRAYIGAGVGLYALLGADRSVPRHRHLTRRGAKRRVPSLREDALAGAIVLHDGQVDDARHTATVARTAARYGAAIATDARVTGYLRDGERIAGVRVHDHLGDADLEVRAREVVNAAGVWTDELQELVGGQGGFRVRMSKGVHIVVPRERISSEVGMLLRTEKSVLFVIPWFRNWIIGTTDTAWSLDRADPAATKADIDYVLEQVNRVLDAPLTHDDIQGVYSGLRPLLEGNEASDTTKLSREHSVAEPVPGLTVVAGGKYTTYRVMARDTVDVVAAALGRPVPPSPTHLIPLLGAEGYPALRNARGRLAQESGLPVERIDHLLGRYGAETARLLALVAERPELAEPLPGADAYLAVEALWAATHEGALHLDDVLARRTRIAFEVWDRGVEAAEPVARLVAPVLGWDEERTRREVDAYRARVAAERASQAEATDEAADAAWLAARQAEAVGAGS